MKVQWFLALVPAAAIAAFACSGSGDDSLVQGSGNAPPVDHPPIQVQGTSASPRRLSTDQLRASLPIAFGNDATGAPITWKNGANPALANPDITRSLGEPDYIDTTDEALEPSVLYAKFMDDAARSLCSQGLDADATRTDAGQRALLRHVELGDTVESKAAGVDANLRYLVLRFHAVHVAEGDTATVAPLRELFTTVSRASTATDPKLRAREGWNAVCVALVTAPEFNLY